MTDAKKLFNKLKIRDTAKNELSKAEGKLVPKKRWRVNCCPFWVEQLCALSGKNCLWAIYKSTKEYERTLGLHTN